MNQENFVIEELVKELVLRLIDEKFRDMIDQDLHGFLRSAIRDQ